MKVLLVGAAGHHAREVAHRLLAGGHTVIGLDSRPWPAAPVGIELHQVDVRKRAGAEVFRRHRPEAVIHMGTVTHFDAGAETRFRVNLRGTQAVLEHCHRFGARHLVFVSRHTVYGAAPDAPLYRTEDEPPMAGSTFPELGDLVAADLYAASGGWRFPDLATVVLRVVYVLGPSRSGTLASFLRGPRVPAVLGFDPLFQFMHEHDAAEAIVRAVERRLAGVFNVAGPQPVPLSLLCRETGRQRIPIPERLIRHALGRLGLPSLPVGAVSHLKHPVVVDDRAFRRVTEFAPRFDESETMRSFAEGVP